MKALSTKCSKAVVLISGCAMMVIYAVLICNNYADGGVYYAVAAAVDLFAGVVLAAGIIVSVKNKIPGWLLILFSLFIPLIAGAGWLTTVFIDHDGDYFMEATYLRETLFVLWPVIMLFLIRIIAGINSRIQKSGKIEITQMQRFIGGIILYFALAGIIAYLIEVEFNLNCYSRWDFFHMVYLFVIADLIIIKEYPRMFPDYCGEHLKLILYIIAGAVTGICSIAIIWTNYHMREILYSLGLSFVQGEYQFGDVDWLGYRSEALKGLFRGDYVQGYNFLSIYPDEAPVHVFWNTKPLITSGVEYGAGVAMIFVILFAVLIISMFLISSNCRTENRSMCFYISIGFLLTGALSIITQLLLVANVVFFPLIGRGAFMLIPLCAFFMFSRAKSPIKQTETADQCAGYELSRTDQEDENNCLVVKANKTVYLAYVSMGGSGFYVKRLDKGSSWIEGSDDLIGVFDSEAEAQKAIDDHIAALGDN